MRKAYEPGDKDRFLKVLNDGAGSFIKDVDINEELGIPIPSLVHYAKEMEALDYIRTAHSKDGWSFIITESGIHFAANDTFEGLFWAEETRDIDNHFDLEDERLTRKVSRRTARGTLAISILAFLVAAFALIAQILGWFTAGN